MFFFLSNQGKWGIGNFSRFTKSRRGTDTRPFEYLSTATGTTWEGTQGTHVNKKKEKKLKFFF